MPHRKLPPVPAGEVLLEEFLKPLGISQYQLAKDISVPPRRINEIVHGKRAVTADTGTEVFTWPDGGQTPFAQSKGTVMEGGFRALAMIRWPGRVPAGKVE